MVTLLAACQPPPPPAPDPDAPGCVVDGVWIVGGDGRQEVTAAVTTSDGGLAAVGTWADGLRLPEDAPVLERRRGGGVWFARVGRDGEVTARVLLEGDAPGWTWTELAALPDGDLALALSSEERLTDAETGARVGDALLRLGPDGATRWRLPLVASGPPLVTAAGDGLVLAGDGRGEVVIGETRFEAGGPDTPTGWVAGLSGDGVVAWTWTAAGASIARLAETDAGVTATVSTYGLDGLTVELPGGFSLPRGNPPPVSLVGLDPGGRTRWVAQDAPRVTAPAEGGVLGADDGRAGWWSADGVAEPRPALIGRGASFLAVSEAGVLATTTALDATLAPGSARPWTVHLAAPAATSGWFDPGHALRCALGTPAATTHTGAGPDGPWFAGEWRGDEPLALDRYSVTPWVAPPRTDVDRHAWLARFRAPEAP